MTPSAAEFEEVACQAAQAAGEYLRERFQAGPPIRVETKGLHDFVSEVDREAETRILSLLENRFPDHGIMSEEASPEAITTGYRWIIDPLDGTTNFIHGVPTFSVSIALEDDDGLVAAAIHDPCREETFHGHRDGGARLNGETIRCTALPGLEDALLATGFPFRELSRVGPYLEVFEAFIRSTAGLRRAGSAAIDLAYTACGRYDGFWELGLSRWDIAAGVLLLREAGGTITDLVGGDRFLDSGDIIAAGPSLHRAMLEVARRSF